MFIKIKNRCLLTSCNSGHAKAAPGFGYNGSAHWPRMVAFHGHQQSYGVLRRLTENFPVVAERAISSPCHLL